MKDSSSRTPQPIQFMLEDDGPSFVGIKRALVARIGKEWSVGDRLPPIRELARTMAVSPNNVQRAVKELVQEGVLFSRRRLGSFVRALPEEPGTRPDDTGASLQGRTIAMVVFQDPIPLFVQRMVTGFQKAIDVAGATTSLRIQPEGSNVISPAPGCWGMVLFNPSSDLQVRVGFRNVTVVSTADHIHPDLVGRFDRIGVDQYQGGMLAGQVLRRAGCRDACFMGHRVADRERRFDRTSSSRLHGFEQAWGEPLTGSNLIYAAAYGIRAGAACFREYLKRVPRPEAVFTASDELAMGFMAAATAAGLVAGKDFHLVGFDGQDEYGSASDARLTTIRVPAARMGQVAAQMMLLRAADRSRPVQRIALPCAVSVGSTCRAEILT